MNRQQKRNFQKNLNKTVKKNPMLSQLASLSDKAPVNREGLSIPEGTKVQFRIEKMKSHPDWNKLDTKYKEFVEQHVDTVFTVVYDEQYPVEPLWVCLAEDPNPIKWLFYIGDLKKA